jgi:hypothetical protein
VGDGVGIIARPQELAEEVLARLFDLMGVART